MNLILYTWGSNSDEVLKKNLIELGYEVVIFDKKCEHYTRDLKFAQGLINLIHETDAEGVITNDYFPVISMVCNTTGILYYSWVYDSPHYTLFAATAKYPCNRIGCFDKALVRRLNDIGIDTVKHLPLGVDWTDAVCPSGGKSNSADKAGKVSRYTSDVSFVGSFYTDAYNYYDKLSDDDIRARADVFIKKQCFEYKQDYLNEFFAVDNAGIGMNNNDATYEPDQSNSMALIKIIRDILVNENLLPGAEYIEDVEYIFSSHFLEKKVTVEERRILFNEMAERKYDFALYTGSDLAREPVLKKKNRGIVNYYKEMPIVFKNSKINLNITLRSIKTGIPLRALDIMGCGGFLLSNYQEELAESFREGEEVVLFYSLEDCLEKIDYYLSHEEERKKIAKAGHEAVKQRFNYRDQLGKLLML